MSTKNGAREGPGEPREVLGDPRGLPGVPGGGQGSRLDSRGPLLGAIWPPFWMPFSIPFSSEFRAAFFNDFKKLSASLLAPFWEPKSIQEGLGREKVDLQKPLFYLSKTILFELGGPPGLPKSLPETTSKFIPIV